MTGPLRVQVTLGDFRRKTADLPDETAIFIEYEDCSDWHEISAIGMKYLPAALDAPPALLIDGGQQFDEEHYLGERLDVYLDCGDWNAGLKP
jgi:hypothetical protein